ncbi:Hypothetical_protein [Hexamita inflata]|uniref:Hypothetical_protein n=1 Tax=Hexamita inflata TaxID=28002 RepID=A0AA86QMT0_9EUKA|nr:Hypothetical protein HINF_LOCUS50194 [Hexamita inflata]
MYTFSLNSLSRIPGAAWGVFPVPRSCLLRETVIPSFILFYYFIPSSSLLVPQYSLFPSITLSLHSHSFPLFPPPVLTYGHLNQQVVLCGGLVVVSRGLVLVSLSPLLHYSLLLPLLLTTPPLLPLLLTTTTTPPGTTWDYRPCALVLLRGCGAWVGEAGVGVGAWVGWIAGWRGGGCVGIGQCINVGEYVVDIVQQ